MPEHVSAVVLAAGSSRRFRAGPKQLAVVAGESSVRRTVRLVARSSCMETVVVTGYRDPAIRAEIEDLAPRIVYNGQFESGQSSSVRAGLEALSPTSEGALFVPCDQPFLDLGSIEALLERWRRDGGIVVPVYGGRRGAPVLFPRELFAELSSLTGDVGGRALLCRHPDQLGEVELASADPLEDFDTLEDLQKLCAGRRRREDS